jgi:D-sorbitol dehydrogenase (acceptor)
MAELMRLDGRHALLTGAGGGIGLAAVEAFLIEGARCTAVDLAAQPSAGLAALLARYPGRLSYASADVARTASLGALVDAAAQRLGTVDVLFNNAAIFDMAPLLESDEAMYQRLFDVNVKGMFFTMQAVLARLVAAGRPGSIVNLASQAGRRGEALVSHYCASKAAVISYTQSAALAMAPHGIRVNGIGPGTILTELAKQAVLTDDAARRKILSRTPLGRCGEPEEVAAVAAFLASDDASYLTGQTIYPDGGRLALNYTMPVG